MGDELVSSWLALLWYSLSPLLCVHAWKCLRLEPFCRKVFSLSVFLFLFLSLAIPQFGLLSHVSSLKLSLGHSGPVLILSNVARASLFSPHLLVADVSVWANSLLGVVVRSIICGLYLFIFSY